ncbi:MAG TPA: ATP-binding cassette domain-containing protein [Lacipirellulaceae bacterium]|nr:ATP-binding cassette domain-containing protein [Lacipirellulaceae bacterium]
MLRFSGVSKAYGSKTIVPPFDLTVKSGEVLVLLGPSGCGKTTILRMVAGLVKASAGEIVVDDLVLSGRTLPDVRRRLGYVIQEGGLFPHLTAAANVTLMARHQRWSRGRRDQRLAELVEMTRFPPDALSRYPIELSGGQRQRVSLMRALFLSPHLLLLDEPLGALDPMIRAGLQRDLKVVFERTGATVLLVTHDLVEASWFADRVCMLENGRIVQQGSFASIVNEPASDFVREFVNSQIVANR